MRWTCQAESGGPLWWPLDRADHWYRPDTDPDTLADDYRRAHPEHRSEPLVLRCWRSWNEPQSEVRVAGALDPAAKR